MNLLDATIEYTTSRTTGGTGTTPFTGADYIVPLVVLGIIAILSGIAIWRASTK